MSLTPSLRIAKCIVLAASLALPTVLSAQTTITIRTTADNTDLGWEQDDVVTFTFTLIDDRLTSSGDSIAPPFIEYVYEDSVQHNAIFSNVTFTGAGGAFRTTFGDSGDANSYLFLSNTSTGLIQTLRADTDNRPAGIGLTTPDGSKVKVVGQLSPYAPMNITGTFPLTGAYLTPGQMFAGSYGTYTDTTFQITVQSEDFTEAFFTPISFTIAATSAVPEPSSYAMICGLSILGMVAGRRRSRSSVSV